LFDVSVFPAVHLSSLCNRMAIPRRGVCLAWPARM